MGTFQKRFWLNVPSEMIISTNIPSATSFANYQSSNQELYWFDNNTIWMRFEGAGDGLNPPYGDTLQASSTPLSVCHPTGCSGQAITTQTAVIADYEMGLDERAFMTTNGDLTLNPITFDAGAAPGGSDNLNGFSLTTDGDGVDEWVEYVIPFQPRQVWTDFTNLHLNFTGPDLDLVITDASEGDILLGTFKAGTYDDIGIEWLDKPRTDEIIAVKLRLKESMLGSLEVGGVTAEVQIFNITIEVIEDGVHGGGASSGGRARASGGHVVLLNNQPGWSYLLGTGACWYGG